MSKVISILCCLTVTKNNPRREFCPFLLYQKLELQQDRSTCDWTERKHRREKDTIGNDRNGLGGGGGGEEGYVGCT